MRQVQKKKEKDKIAIALMLCFCVIALTSIFTIKANVDKIQKSGENIPVSDETSTKQTNNSSNNNLSSVDKPSLEQASNGIKTIESKPSNKEQENKSASSYVFPVKASEVSITNPYSMDSLIYSITLDQYMTHCGIDIQAPSDSQVVAVSNGTVTSIYEDDRFGTSIEISHSDELVSIYSNLSTSDMVEIGDVVYTGQVIAGVGSSSLFESLEPSHLHFEILKAGVYTDPSKYIPLP